MASTTYWIDVRDSTITSGDNRKTGLSPTVVIAKSGATDVSSHVSSVTEVGGGLYTFTYDPEAYGEAVCQIDCTSALTNGSDRYISQALVRDSSRVQAGISSSGTVTVGTNNDKTGYTASTVSDKTGYALTSAEHTAISGTDVPAGLTARGLTASLVELLAASAGSWTLAGNVLTMTSFGGGHTFTVTVDSVTNPTTWTVAQTS